MNTREISKFLANYVFILASFLLLPTLFAFYYQFLTPAKNHPQPHSTYAFLITIFICVTLGLLLYFYGRKSKGKRFFRREGFLSVILIWLISGVIGGLPFYISGTLQNPIDAYFEAMSGFTTTGSTVMFPENIDPVTKENMPIQRVVSDRLNIKYTFYGNIKPILNPDTGVVMYAGLDAVGKALLFWRCFMQWLGGMGIVVLFIAILPAYGLGGNKLLVQAELPGPSKENIAPRAKEAASLLWRTYLAFTVLEIFLLKTINFNISWYDSMLIAFSTISTGGFLPLKEGIQVYNTAGIQWVMIIFMLMGSMNFTLHFHVIKGKLYHLFDPEFILYILTLFIGSSLVIISLIGSKEMLFSGRSIVFNWASAFRYGIFEYISCQSSTGVVLVDYDQWPFFAQAIMVSAMYIGGMSCSTAGGIKVIRYYILLKTAAVRTESIFKPDMVKTFKIRNQSVSPVTKETVLTFFFLVIAFSFLATIVYISDGMDFRTAFSVTSSMINNVGVAYGPGGSSQTFAFLSNFSKLMSTFWMLLGRLEFFLILILFTPTFWKSR